MKVTLRVFVVARKKVQIVVERDEDEDPRYLLAEDKEAAREAFELGQEPDIDFEYVERVGA